MLEDLESGEALFRTPLEHFCEQVFCLVADVLPLFGVKLELLTEDVFKDNRVVVTFEGWIATEEDVKDDA